MNISLMIQANRPIYKESRIVENTASVILAKQVTIPQKRLQYITDANK